MLEIDRGKLRQEAKLDGKYLISTSDDYLSAEEVGLGYEQLHEIERVNRDLKHTVDVRPVYHRREDRIGSLVQLCWLALLLIRLIETRTQQTWHQLVKIMRPLSVAYQQSQHGLVMQNQPREQRTEARPGRARAEATQALLAVTDPHQGRLTCRHNQFRGTSGGSCVQHA